MLNYTWCWNFLKNVNIKQDKPSSLFTSIKRGVHFLPRATLSHTHLLFLGLLCTRFSFTDSQNNYIYLAVFNFCFLRMIFEIWIQIYGLNINMCWENMNIHRFLWFQVKKLLLQEGYHHTNDFYMCDNQPISARRIDEYSRFLFPIAFVMFNFMYWTYYLQ